MIEEEVKAMIRIGDVIRTERQRKQLTQQQLADYLNVTKATISKWEKEHSYPDITLLPILAAYFDITVDRLLNAKSEMTKKDVRQWYSQYREKFSQQPFEDVFEAIQHDQKMYFDDDYFLLQLSILLLNHAELSPNMSATFQHILNVLERVEEITQDVWIERQVNVLIALTALFTQQPDVALERLAGSTHPVMNEETLLAQAYEAKEEIVEAQKVLQSAMFQQMLGLIGSSVAYLRLVQDDDVQFHATIERTEKIIDAYEVEEIHPHAALQFYYAVAQLSAVRQDEALCERYIQQYVKTISTKLFPIYLKGDAYFHLLDEWLETLDLGAAALRDEEIVRQSISKSLEHPAFEHYEHKTWFISYKKQLEEEESL